MLSPVMGASFTVAAPDSITPSTGIRRPERTTTVAPGRTSLIGTSTSTSAVTIQISWSSVDSKERIAARVRCKVSISRYSPKFKSQRTVSAVTFSRRAMLERVAAPIRVPVVMRLRPTSERQKARKKSYPVITIPDTDKTCIGVANGPAEIAPQIKRLNRISESLKKPRVNLRTRLRTLPSGLPRSFSYEEMLSGPCASALRTRDLISMDCDPCHWIRIRAVRKFARTHNKRGSLRSMLSKRAATRGLFCMAGTYQRCRPGTFESRRISGDGRAALRIRLRAPWLAGPAPRELPLRAFAPRKQRQFGKSLFCAWQRARPSPGFEARAELCLSLRL